MLPGTRYIVLYFEKRGPISRAQDRSHRFLLRDTDTTHGSDLCMRKAHRTRAARPNEAMCDRLGAAAVAATSAAANAAARDATLIQQYCCCVAQIRIL